jgi:hypothetical protein
VNRVLFADVLFAGMSIIEDDQLWLRDLRAAIEDGAVRGYGK